MITIRHLTRPLAIIIAALASFSLLSISPLAPRAHASTIWLSSFDARLLHDMNQARAARGIRQLVLVPGTTDIAHGWSCHLRYSHTLAHNPYLGGQLDTHGSYYWTTYGENVGLSPTRYGADALFHAYMNSPAHRANILDPTYKYVGVYSKRGTTYWWNTVDFVGQWTNSYSYAYGATRRTC